jgi:nucleobase transporter 1/2
MVTSVIQIVIGFSGLVGFLLRFIGPITIAPTIALIGLSLVNVCLTNAGKYWGGTSNTIAATCNKCRFFIHVRNK